MTSFKQEEVVIVQEVTKLQALWKKFYPWVMGAIIFVVGFFLGHTLHFR